MCSIEVLQEFSAFFQYFDTVSIQIDKISSIKKKIFFFFSFARNTGKFWLVSFEQVV